MYQIFGTFKNNTYICITLINNNQMAKSQKCKLRLHGSTREILTSEFESISKAKEWVNTCWDRPYTVVRIKEPVKQ